VSGPAQPPPDHRLDVVVLSPHLDDAVLSLGALLARLIGAGHRVQVWTAFTAGPDPATLPGRLRVFGDYRVRIAEDDRALDLLGAGRRRLGLPERLWRDPRPAGLSGVFRTPPTQAGFSELPTLVELIGQALADPAVRLYAPLGIGHHADHVEVALAAFRAATEAGALHRTAFYEDFYALGEATRRRHPVSRLRPDARFAAPGWRVPAFGLGIRLLALLPRGPGLDGYLPGLADLDWNCRPQPVGSFEPAKLAAVEQYSSQLSRLGGRRRVIRVLRQAHRARGGEVLWYPIAAGATG
jgi:LmbE family N-acetylglucosaminyl deacetylase